MHTIIAGGKIQAVLLASGRFISDQYERRPPIYRISRLQSKSPSFIGIEDLAALVIKEARKYDCGTGLGVGAHGFSQPLQGLRKNIGNNKVKWAEPFKFYGFKATTSQASNGPMYFVSAAIFYRHPYRSAVDVTCNRL
tara:strand:+ start:575 stop:988 length:414 start_codon:yes stop_codon:yes gene_type:complete